MEANRFYLRSRGKICLCYLVTVIMLTVLVFTLLSYNRKNTREFEKIREDVDQINSLIKQKSSTAVSMNLNASKQIKEAVEFVVAKRLARLVNDVFEVKNRLHALQCSDTFFGNFWPIYSYSVGVDDRINYASEELGAKIHSVEATPLCGTNIIKKLLNLDYCNNPPINLIKPSMNPGVCFAFKHHFAEVTVKLGRMIFIDTIELEHIKKSHTPTGDTSSAPKDFELYGVDEQMRDATMLGEFTYDNIEGNLAQQYQLQPLDSYQFLRFKFLSNHGHPNHTCIYRVAVYGSIAP